MTFRECRIYTQAKMMATDADLQKQFALSERELTKYRELIDGARAEAMVGLRYERAQAAAKRPKRTAGE